MKVNANTKENIVLLIGITTYMFFYYAIKKVIDSSVVFVLMSLCYLGVLKLFSKYLAKKKWPF